MATQTNMLKIADLQGALPHFTKNGNIKLGHMWVWSTMKGSNRELRTVKDFGDKTCSGTCGSHCSCCTKSCYVNKSYRYGSVIKGHAINTTWMKKNPNKTFEYLAKQLRNARNKPKYIRINQSGELMSSNELLHWNDLASQYPDTVFYVYTKNYDVISDVIDNNHKLANNLFILISIWHNQGLDCFNKYKHLPNVKAFVYDDGELHIQPSTYCKAYDEHGKLNHNVTCERCRKCFNTLEIHKIIGCKAH